MESKEKIAQELKTEIREWLDKMGFNPLHPPEVKTGNNRFLVGIFVDEPKSLIGEKGKNLTTLQHLFRRVVSKKYNENILVDIDVNDYKKKRTELLRKFALQARERTLNNKEYTELEPMNPFDRRVIHTTLAEYEDVITESTGEGRERKVVVKLA